ncbi:MAG: hypothetical protein RLY95_1147 [Pseudomonadota bacterium]|jgi:hypothetical protein
MTNKEILILHNELLDTLGVNARSISRMFEPVVAPSAISNWRTEGIPSKRLLELALFCGFSISSIEQVRPEFLNKIWPNLDNVLQPLLKIRFLEAPLLESQINIQGAWKVKKSDSCNSDGLITYQLEFARSSKQAELAMTILHHIAEFEGDKLSLRNKNLGFWVQADGRILDPDFMLITSTLSCYQASLLRGGSENHCDTRFTAKGAPPLSKTFPCVHILQKLPSINKPPFFTIPDKDEWQELGKKYNCNWCPNFPQNFERLCLH